jgi:ribosomal protein S18 acetylase RimI-like enzyme
MMNEESQLIISHDMHLVDLPHEQEIFALFFSIDEELGVVAVAKGTPWGTGPDVRPLISGVHVHEDLRRRGIARQLIRYIERGARLDGIGSLALFVHRDNFAAKKMYESAGYRPMLDSGDDIMYVKFLEPIETKEFTRL